MADTETEGPPPKFKLEHSPSAIAGCQDAKCKQTAAKIGRGELRVGFSRFMYESKEWIYIWRHWGCVLPAQIRKMKELTEDDPTKLPGYNDISIDGQKQLKAAFESGRIEDASFKDVRPDLIQRGKGHDNAIKDAVGYKVDVAKRGTAPCRNPTCKQQDIKIKKDELRMGFAIPFDGEHLSWVYKHWKCVTDKELGEVMNFLGDEQIEGFDSIPDHYQTIVRGSFAQSHVLEPPAPPEPKPKQTKSKKGRKSADGAKSAKTRKKRAVAETVSSDDVESPPPKKKRGRPSKKAAAIETDEDNIKPGPKTTKREQEVVEPQVARIQAMAENMRAEATRTTGELKST